MAFLNKYQQHNVNDDRVIERKHIYYYRGSSYLCINLCSDNPPNYLYTSRIPTLGSGIPYAGLIIGSYMARTKRRVINVTSIRGVQAVPYAGSLLVLSLRNRGK